MSHEVHSHTAHHEHPDDVGSRNRLGVILILVADISFALSIDRKSTRLNSSH